MMFDGSNVPADHVSTAANLQHSRPRAIDNPNGLK
jgi:hypothetical protein